MQGKRFLLAREAFFCGLLACAIAPQAVRAADADFSQHVVIQYIIRQHTAKMHSEGRVRSNGSITGDRKDFVVREDGTIARDARTDRSTREMAGVHTEKSVEKKHATNTRSFIPKAASTPGGFSRQLDNNRARPDVGVAASGCHRNALSPTMIETLVATAARRNGVDVEFAKAIAWTESRFGQTVNSPKGARGPMQLMPATARRFNVDDICDPAKNIEGGIEYLRTLIDQFGNPLLVAAAYNAGEDSVRQYGGIPPFRETENYVARVLNRMMGRPMPAGHNGVPAQAGAIVSAQPTGHQRQLTGVIETTETGKFVGGVMQF